MLDNQEMQSKYYTEKLKTLRSVGICKRFRD